MLDLSSHGHDEENDPVHYEDWPENWDIEDIEPGAEEPDCDGSGGTVPEFELWQPTDERSELFIGLCR